MSTKALLLVLAAAAAIAAIALMHRDSIIHVHVAHTAADR